MLNDELDMLEVRLSLLDGHVYRHVITEANVTFQGIPKPYNFAENIDRFEPWLDRIIYIGVDDLPGGNQPDPPCWSPEPRLGLSKRAWDREDAQREHLKRGLGGSESEDIILHGDVDELPSPSALRRIKFPYAVVLEQREYVFAADWKAPWDCWGTIAVPKKKLGSFTDLRNARRELPRLKLAGWHFSWLGGPEAIERKNATTSHKELAWKVSRMNQKGQLYERGWCPWADVQLQAVDIDETWPRPIAEHHCPESWFRPK